MKAILLCAGYATRLYPLTIDKPKALLPVNGKPMLDYILEHIEKLDVVDEIILVSNHKFIEQMDAWTKTVKTTKKLTLLDDGSTCEDDRLGAIGDIYFAVKNCCINEETVILCGDNLFTFDLKHYYDFYKNSGVDCVCAKKVPDKEEIKGYAVASTDKNGKIIELEEKPKEPKSDLAVFATYFYTGDTMQMVKKYLEEGNKPDAPGYFLQWLYKLKPVHVYEMDGVCYDIGTPKAYEEAQEVFGAKK